MAKLFIDDMRRPPNASWDLVRDTAEAIAYVQQNGCPNEISFDYCLANGLTIMPFIHWLIEQDKKEKIIPQNFCFDSHSSSIAGTSEILCILGGYLKSR